MRSCNASAKPRTGEASLARAISSASGTLALRAAISSALRARIVLRMSLIRCPVFFAPPLAKQGEVGRGCSWRDAEAGEQDQEQPLLNPPLLRKGGGGLLPIPPVRAFHL